MMSLYVVAGITGLICAGFATFVMSQEKVPKNQILFTSVFFGALIFCTVAF